LKTRSQKSEIKNLKAGMRTSEEWHGSGGFGIVLQYVHVRVCLSTGLAGAAKKDGGQALLYFSAAVRIKEKWRVFERAEGR
jgi:hypothetical protein